MIRLQYVGLDVHKETIDVFAFPDDDPAAVVEKRITNSNSSITKTFKKLSERGSVIACYEAGCLGFELQRMLQDMGATCIVAAPGKVPRRPTDRIKTDRRDARRLAEQLRAGTLEAIYIPTQEHEAVRDYLRSRDDLRIELAKMKQRLHKFLLRHGYVFDSTCYWTAKHDRWLRSLQFNMPLLKETFDGYYYRIRELKGHLQLMDTRIEEIALSEPYAQKVQKLRCLKGINYLTALSLVCEVGDFRRFAYAESFMAFLGLIPREWSSGDKRKQGGITKSGNTHLRRLLIQSSWHYRYKSPPSKRLIERWHGQPAEITSYARRAMKRLQTKFFRMVMKGKSSQTAVTAVARELSGFIWGMMVGQTA